jgi:hypothetical protein
MHHKSIKNNADLADGLASLAVNVMASGRSGIAEELVRASRFATGSPSEFLHEAELAIRKTIDCCGDVLTPVQIDELKGVLKQIDEAFDDVGGA